MDFVAYRMKITVRGLSRAIYVVCAFGLQLIICAARLLAVSTQTSASDHDRRSQDSELFGEYNFRTGRLDSGSDQNGWYEEDL